MQNESLFRDKPVWSAIFSMAIPSVFTILVMIVYNMADLFFIGRLGDTAQVGAISIVGPVFSLLSAVSTMIGVGGCATIRECEGTGKFAFKSAADIALGKPGEPVCAVQGDTDKMLPGLNQIQLPFLILPTRNSLGTYTQTFRHILLSQPFSLSQLSEIRCNCFIHSMLSFLSFANPTRHQIYFFQH